MAKELQYVPTMVGEYLLGRLKVDLLKPVDLVISRAMSGKPQPQAEDALGEYLFGYTEEADTLMRTYRSWLCGALEEMWKGNVGKQLDCLESVLTTMFYSTVLGKLGGGLENFLACAHQELGVQLSAGDVRKLGRAIETGNQAVVSKLSRPILEMAKHAKLLRMAKSAMEDWITRRLTEDRNPNSHTLMVDLTEVWLAPFFLVGVIVTTQKYIAGD